MLVVFGGADARVALGTVIGIDPESFPMSADIAERTVVSVKYTSGKSKRI